MAGEPSSPLKQVNAGQHEPPRPKAFAIYDELFKVSQHDRSYWVELYSLPVHESYLKSILDSQDTDRLLRNAPVTRQLVSTGINYLGDDKLHVNALNILRVVFVAVSGKKMTAADTINILVGLDKAETVFDTLTDHLLRLIGKDFSRPATKFVLAVASSALDSGLTSIFMQKNFFAAFVRLIDACTGDGEDVFRAFLALGALATLARFDDNADGQILRIAEFIDDSIMAKMVALAEMPCQELITEFDHKVDAEKATASWLGWLWADPKASAKKGTTTQDMSPKIAILLPLYEFSIHNDLFANKVASSPLIGELVQLGSRILEIGGRSTRMHTYARLFCIIFRHMVEERSLFKELTTSVHVMKIAQNRAPSIILDDSTRPALLGILDCVQVGLRFNAGKKIDWHMYTSLLSIIFQILGELSFEHQVLAYDWLQLIQTLSGVAKYLMRLGEPASTEQQGQAHDLAELLIRVMASGLLKRDIFMVEDYEVWYFRTIRQPSVFLQLVDHYGLRGSAAAILLKTMAQQYELMTTENKTSVSDTVHTVLRQGIGAIESFPDRQLILSGKLPRQSEANMQRFLKSMARVALYDASKT